MNFMAATASKSSPVRVEHIPIEFMVAVTQSPPVVLSPVQERVRQKLAMAGREAELTLEEFAAYRGQSLGSVRKNLDKARCVRRLSQKDTTIHLGTWHDEQGRARAGGL